MSQQGLRRATSALLALSVSIAACADAPEPIGPQFDHVGDGPHSVRICVAGEGGGRASVRSSTVALEVPLVPGECRELWSFDPEEPGTIVISVSAASGSRRTRFALWEQGRQVGWQERDGITYHGSLQLGDELADVVEMASSYLDHPASDGRAELRVEFAPAPDLHVRVTPVQPTFNPFDRVEFEVRMRNDGPVVARDVRVYAFLPLIGSNWYPFVLRDEWGNALPMPACHTGLGFIECTIAELRPHVEWGLVLQADAGDACEIYTIRVLLITDDAAAYDHVFAQPAGCSASGAPDVRTLAVAAPPGVQAGEPMSFTMMLLNAGLASADWLTLEGTLPSAAGLTWSISSVRTGSLATAGFGWSPVRTEDQNCFLAQWTFSCRIESLSESAGIAVTFTSQTASAACGEYQATASTTATPGRSVAHASLVGCAVPVADAGGPYAAVEGSAVAFDGSATTNAGDASYVWDFGDGTMGTGVSPSHVYADNGSYTARLTVGTSVAAAVVTVSNAAPVVHAITLPADPVAIGAQVFVSGTYSDAGAADTHTALLTWTGGGSAAAAAAGAFNGSLTFGAPGVHAIQAAVTDDDGGVGVRTSTLDSPSYVVVYDPQAGFVTGGGWVESPAGAWAPDAAAAGHATFGFVARYARGSSEPAGHAQFRFNAGDLRFASSVFEWLVVAGARAQVKGRGQIDGAGDYGFLLTAVDGQVPGGGGMDRFRIKIWDRATGLVLYDNQRGTDDSALPTTVLGGGSIVIRQ